MHMHVDYINLMQALKLHALNLIYDIITRFHRVHYVNILHLFAL